MNRSRLAFSEAHASTMRTKILYRSLATGMGFLSLALACATASGQTPEEAAASFDNNFLHNVKGQPGVDLSVFAFSNRVLPGTRTVLLRLNRQPLGTRDIEFVAQEGKEDAQPCFTVTALEELGVNIKAFAPLLSMDPTDCTAPLAAIPQTSIAYDHEKNILDLSIPQAALDRKARGLVSADLWDSGKTALWSSYRIGHNQMSVSGGGSNSHSTFASFRNGLNLGEWRVRNNGSFYQSNGESTWDWTDVYAERGIVPLRSWLRLGASSTPGNIFSSSRFRGLQMQSDESMLPDSQRGYAPVVRGIANGNAKVTVRQNGYVVYTTFVPAGPFVIDDLYSTPGGGDLQVEIEELGGRVTRFSQPFSALPLMMREGILSYNFVAGEHRSRFDSERPMMSQFTMAYGLPGGLTGYGGAMVAEGSYQAGALGMALNMETLGAVSSDITGSRSRDDRGKSISGIAARIQYAKSFPGSGTDFTLAGYRYNSAGFRSLDDAVRDRSGPDSDLLRGLSRVNEYQLSLSQRIGTRASVSFNYFGVSYRNAPSTSTFAQLGVSSSIGRVGYSLTYGVNRSPWSRRESTVMFTMNIPLGGSHNGSYAIGRSSGQGTSQDATLSGALTDDYALTYALQAGVTSGSGEGARGYGALGYAGPTGIANVSHAYSKRSSNTNLDVSGAILLDGKGVLLGQSLGETAIIVEAPGASGVEVDSFPGVRTNGDGRALIPYANAYRENRVSLTPNFDDADTTLEHNVQTVVPTRGAIVVARFDTEIGRAMLVVLRNDAGMELPFGAAVFDKDNEQKGIVGPVGRVWLTGLAGANRFTVRWGNDQENQCAFDIEVPAGKSQPEEKSKELTCV